MRYTILPCSLALPWPAAVRAADAVPSVTISAGKLVQRRNDTVSAITVGHDELIRQGNRTLLDMLKRLPGITILPGQRQVARSLYEDGAGRMLRSVRTGSYRSWRLMLEGRL